MAGPQEREPKRDGTGAAHTPTSGVEGTTMTMTDNDDTVLAQLRRACADQSDDSSQPADLRQLYALRDEALSRGLPLPSSCPMDAAGAS